MLLESKEFNDFSYSKLSIIFKDYLNEIIINYKYL
jgi:hypothetical protein